MAFQQLYYTSCETGLAGYGGYQFNAATPGTSPLVMREVEDRTVYEPPRWLLADPCLDEPEAYPVALLYANSEGAGAAIVAQVMFAGTDYSGRPGNYFAHALVTSTPGPDFGPLLPAELWGADLWRNTPIESQELPELHGPLPRGVVDRTGVQAFLDAHGTEKVLPELLTAVIRAMADDRPVLLANQDANENIWWIAAISYLLGEHLALEMTFTTYSHRPGYSRHHLIGVLSDSVPPDADSSFQLFDLDAGKTPGGEIHPLASLLAGTGIIATEGLWRQAMAFASGAEEAPDDWLGPVTAAAGLLGRALSDAETQTVARWLPAAADRMPAQHADIALGVALAQPDAALSDEQLLGLLDLARQLPSRAHAERLERLLVDRATAHLARGEPAVLVQPQSLAVIEVIQAQIADLLQRATPEIALAALDWAVAAGATPSEAGLERYGRASLGPGLPEPELMQILRTFPGTLRGLLAQLAIETPQLAETVLAGPVGELIGRNDLLQYPMLTVEWRLACVAQGRMEPMRAFDEIVDIRSKARQRPIVDGLLLGRLWPTGCPASRITELLDSDSVIRSSDPEVLDWLVAQIDAAAAHGTKTDGWLRLAQAITTHRLLPMLPRDLARTVQDTVSAAPKLRRARAAVNKGDVGVFAGLYDDYRAADDRTRGLWRDNLADMLCNAEPLYIALRGCPTEVMEAFCHRLERFLAPSRADARIAARVFEALTEPGLQAQLELFDQLRVAFEQVSSWRRRDLNFLAQFLARYPPGVAELFQEWRENHRGGLARKLFGGHAGPPKGTEGG